MGNTGFLALTVAHGTLWNGALVALIDNWSDHGSFIGFLPLPSPLSMFPGSTSYVFLTWGLLLGTPQLGYWG